MKDTTNSISVVQVFRCGDSAERKEQRKQRRGGVGGWGEKIKERGFLLSPSPTPPPFVFSPLSILRHTPLSQRLQKPMPWLALLFAG